MLPLQGHSYPANPAAAADRALGIAWPCRSISGRTPEGFGVGADLRGMTKDVRGGSPGKGSSTSLALKGRPEKTRRPFDVSATFRPPVYPTSTHHRCCDRDQALA